MQTWCEDADSRQIRRRSKLRAGESGGTAGTPGRSGERKHHCFRWEEGIGCHQFADAFPAFAQLLLAHKVPVSHPLLGWPPVLLGSPRCSYSQAKAEWNFVRP